MKAKPTPAKATPAKKGLKPAKKAVEEEEEESDDEEEEEDEEEVIAYIVCQKYNVTVGNLKKRQLFKMVSHE